MKRLIPILLICILLCGCSPKLSDKAENGDPWDDAWTAIGTQIGVSALPNGFTLYEYNDVQGLDGIYYASFTCGESTVITNDSGKEAELFPAQLYLLTQECLEEEEAAKAIAQWKAVGESSYTLTQADPIGDYQVYFLAPKSESPFVSGILALGIHNDVAISVELMCAENIFENEQEVLAEFLESLRFRGMEG